MNAGVAIDATALRRVRRRALVVAVLGLILYAFGATWWPGRAYHAWLFGYIFWLGVALGCLAIVMIQHITGGAWGLALRRILESGARTIPAMALLFVPVLFGMKKLYPWARPELVAANPHLQHKVPYLNPTFFTVRAAIYFACWSLLAWLLSRWSRRQDETGDERFVDRFQKLSAGGLLVFVLTMTFASVDWVMSMEPFWFSTIYGGLLMTGFAVSAFCFAVAVAILLARSGPLERLVTPKVLHDLGKLMFAFVMVWAYFALSQFLIIWYGNLPEEIPWYQRRFRGGWQWLGLVIILFHFALPFLLLLSRSVKRDSKRLLRVAVLVFVMRLVDLYWVVAPGYFHDNTMHWLDMAAVVGLGGLWVVLFTTELARVPPLPQRDPYLTEALAHAND